MVKIRLGFFYFVLVQKLFAEIEYNFPALATPFLSGVQEYAKTYESYSRVLCLHYGRAVAFTNHLSYPVGKDNLGSFPSLYTGIGLGSAFSNTLAMKQATNENLTGGVIPKILPTLGFSLNFGVGLSEKWDIRFSFLPPVQIALPQQISDIQVRFRYGNGRAKVTYNWLKSSFLKPGVSFAGYFSYTQGSVQFAKDNVNSLNHTYSYFDGFINHPATVSFNYNFNTEASWQYSGIGGEVRLWYDLWLVIPYIGWGLGLQGGRFQNQLTIDGNIVVSIPGINPVAQNDTGYAKIREKARADTILSRFIFGLEINLLFTRIATEAQVDTTNQLVGIALGTAFAF